MSNHQLLQSAIEILSDEGVQTMYGNEKVMKEMYDICVSSEQVTEPVYAIMRANHDGESKSLYELSRETYCESNQLYDVIRTSIVADGVLLSFKNDVDDFMLQKTKNLPSL
jgi:hypothetical protein